MKLVQTPIQRGPRGKALVTPTKKSLRISLEGKEYEYALADLEFTLPPKFVGGEYLVSLSKDEGSLYSLRPWNATVVGVFAGFAAKKDQPPIPEFPRERKGVNQSGETYDKDWLEMRPVFTVVEPPNLEGLGVTGTLRYNFTKDEEENAGFSNIKSKYTAELINFLDRTSGDAANLSLRFSDNLLPPLERILVERNRRVMLIIEKGYIKTYGEAFSAPTGKKKVAPKGGAKPKTKKK